MELSTRFLLILWLLLLEISNCYQANMYLFIRAVVVIAWPPRRLAVGQFWAIIIHTYLVCVIVQCVESKLKSQLVTLRQQIRPEQVLTHIIENERQSQKKMSASDRKRDKSESEMDIFTSGMIPVIAKTKREIGHRCVFCFEFIILLICLNAAANESNVFNYVIFYSYQ